MKMKQKGEKDQTLIIYFVVALPQSTFKNTFYLSLKDVRHSQFKQPKYFMDTNKSSHQNISKLNRIFNLSQDQRCFIQYHLPKGFAFISQSSLNQKKRKTGMKEVINISLKDKLQPATMFESARNEERLQRPIRKVVSEQKKKKERELQKSKSQQKDHSLKSSQKQEQSSQNKDLSSNMKKDELQSVQLTQNSIMQDKEDRPNSQGQISKSSNKSKDQEIKLGNKLLEIKDKEAVQFDNNTINPHFWEEYTILKNLKQHDAIEPFLCPVDQIRDSAPNYYKIIKQPIDLETIEQKFHSQAYTDPNEFHLDIEKMLANSRRYNEGNACMIKLTNQVQKFYQRLIGKNQSLRGETVQKGEGSNSAHKKIGRTTKKESIAMKKRMKEK